MLSLDLLRATAIMLVIGRHVELPADAHAFFRIWNRGGWLGVDLFFVLSGFLVSGLLFSEHKSHGIVSIKNFLIRRSFKIYPSFYAFLFLTVVIIVIHDLPAPISGVVSEILFVQNYVGGVWGHTWSLAVEEHFYLCLIAGAAFLSRCRSIASGWTVTAAFIAVSSGLLVLRAFNCQRPFQPITHVFPTHLRFDALAFGSLIAYFWHNHPSASRMFARRWRLAMAVLGIGLLSPGFIWPLEQYRLIPTVGVTAFYLGSGSILTALLGTSIPLNLCTRTIAQIGVNSYSIYLWHMPVIRWLVPVAEKRLSIVDPAASVAVAVIASVTTGMLMARLVELPMLRLRNRLFPSRAHRGQAQMCSKQSW